MAESINWTLTAREARQEILESLATNDVFKNKSQKFVVMLRTHLKYIAKYNFAGVEANFSGLRETTCGGYKILYKIRTNTISIMGIFQL
ncbi:MAG: hypothetical protein OCD76_15935 [Reichenbachiella sp.]